MEHKIKHNKPILRDPLDSENAKEMQKKIDDEDLNRHLNDVKHICHDVIKQLEGDDYSLGTVKKLEQAFRVLDHNPVSSHLKNEHWNKFLALGMQLKEHILKFSSFVAMLQIRYTSKNANIKVIDRTLDEATLGGKEIQMKMPPNTSVLPSESNPLSVDVSNLRNKIGYSIKELDKKEIEDIKKEDKENGNR